jgi:hypothetical protein
MVGAPRLHRTDRCVSRNSSVAGALRDWTGDPSLLEVPVRQRYDVQRVLRALHDRPRRPQPRDALAPRLRGRQPRLRLPHLAPADAASADLAPTPGLTWVGLESPDGRRRRCRRHRRSSSGLLPRRTRAGVCTRRAGSNGAAAAGCATATSARTCPGRVVERAASARSTRPVSRRHRQPTGRVRRPRAASEPGGGAAQDDGAISTRLRSRAMSATVVHLPCGRRHPPRHDHSTILERSRGRCRRSGRVRRHTPDGSAQGGRASGTVGHVDLGHRLGAACDVMESGAGRDGLGEGPHPARSTAEERREW